MQIKLRNLKPDDVNFVLASMLRSLYYGNEFYNKIEKASFFKNYEVIVKQILDKSQTVVAVLQEDEDVILGYSIGAPEVLHFVFVKQAWRKQGIAKKMFNLYNFTTVTHLTKVGDPIRERIGLTFDPFKI